MGLSPQGMGPCGKGIGIIMNRLENITSNLSVRILHGHWIRHDSHWFEEKTKEHYTLWSIVSGTVKITTEGRDFWAHGKDAVLFFPGCHYSACTESDGCQFIFVFFKLEMGNGLDLFEGNNMEGILSSESIRQKSLHFQSQFRNLSASGQLSLKMYADFLQYLCPVIEGLQSPDATHFSRHIRTVGTPAIRKAIDYIGANYLSNPPVSQLASLVNLSEKRFISNFKNTVGLSPGQYINQLRMRKAAELIRNTDKKMSEVAGIVGYADQYAFSKAFKRTFGESPTDFRNNVIL